MIAAFGTGTISAWIMRVEVGNKMFP